VAINCFIRWKDFNLCEFANEAVTALLKLINVFKSRILDRIICVIFSANMVAIKTYVQ